MKNIAIGFILCLCLVAFTASAYRQFGPAQTKALIKVLVEELNRNRDWHGKPHITGDIVRDQLETETSSIVTNLANDPDLSWMVDVLR